MADLAVGAALTCVHDVVYLLNKELHFNGYLREEVEICKSWCRSMQAEIRELEGHDMSELQRSRVNEVRGIAYEIEEVLDEFMLHAAHKFHRHEIVNKAHDFAHSCWHWRQLHDLSSKMEQIKKKVYSISSIDSLLHGARLPTSENDRGSGLRAEDQVGVHLNSDDELVGFQCTLETLTQQLRKGESGCLTVSLVGPAGSGKSTLVKNAYNNKRIHGGFHCRAWVHVSRSFSVNDPEKLLSSMLAQFCESRKEPIPSNGVTTLNKLRNYLECRRFFLVLDDIWNEEQLKYFKNVLPSGRGRCRMVVTTRNNDVAACCVENDSHVHDLSAGLQSPQDMDLFVRNAFRARGGKCPLELEELCKEIVSKCGGSPLAIVSVGALLSRENLVPNDWKIFRDSIGSEFHTSSIISKVLLPSYKDLPGNLRRCFLYFSIFPEDYRIEREKLIRLWVSERFVIEAKGKTLEEVAEEYLNELVRRNLVTVTRRDSDGRVRSCRVQKLELEFVVQKSEEDKFVSVLANSGGMSSSGGKIRHLAVHNASTTLSQCRSFGSIRSTLFFRWNGVSPSPTMTKKFLRYCKFMRVLDLQDAPISEFPEHIVCLPLLRYLSLRNTKIKMIPNSLKKLSFLETLDLKKTEVTQLPQKIIYLRNLRHLLVDHRNAKTSLRTFGSVQGVAMVAGIGGLANLQKLSLLKPDKSGKIISELGALTQLRKLGIVQLNEGYEKDLCTSIGKMKNLATLDLTSTSKDHCLKLEKLLEPPCYLQRLYLKGRLQRLPDWIRSLANLFRVRLMWSKLQVSPLESLQFLPNLLELQMVDAYTGGELVFKAGGFRKLKTLLVEQFDQLHTIVIQKRAMPELQKMTLRKCDNLMNLPAGIKYLTRVEELLLYAMQDELVNRFQKNGVSREWKMARHIPVIRSFSLTENQLWSCNDLS